MGRIKPYDTFLHTATIDSGISFEYKNIGGYAQVVVFLSDKSVDAHGAMQMVHRVRHLVKHDGRAGGLISFLCDQAIRDWDFRPGYLHNKRITGGDRLNAESSLKNEIDECLSAIKVLPLLLSKGQDNVYSWNSQRKKCWFDFTRRIPPESATEGESEYRIFLPLAMNAALKRERDGKTIESHIDVDKLHRESPKYAEAILELRGYKWFRKILILHQNRIDNQKRDFMQKS